MHDDELTPLLVAERPRPREAFAAELDARVAARFPPRPRPARAGSASRTSRWAALLQRPFLPVAATVLAVGFAAIFVTLGSRDRAPRSGASTSGIAQDDLRAGGKLSGGTAESRAQHRSRVAGAFQDQSAQALAPDERALARREPGPSTADSGVSALSAAPLPTSARKVERTASLELGTASAHVDDVAQGVLGVVARFDGIVDSSSVQSGPGGGAASFELRIPAARLEAALAALSRLPDARVFARSDDTRDVNQTYVSVRRRLVNARAERAGVVRALAAADTEDETLRLRDRLDALERTIAQAERSQRELDRRVDYSRVAVAIHGGAGGAAVPGDDGSFGIGDAAHDALRVLEVAAGVVVIAAAALVPLAVLAAVLWPLARALGRRRREQALDAA